MVEFLVRTLLAEDSAYHDGEFRSALRCVLARRRRIRWNLLALSPPAPTPGSSLPSWSLPSPWPQTWGLASHWTTSCALVLSLRALPSTSAPPVRSATPPTV